MSILEAVLLVAGVVLAIASFLIPAKKEEMPKDSKKMAQDEIRAIIDKEMDLIRQHVDDVVDESIEYAVEKTERSLERLTNEKIMAVNEYSDTVLREIHKNHEEAMFLYDMLNAKHTNIKNTVSEVNRTVKEVSEKIQETESEVDSFRKLKVETVTEDRKVVENVQPEQAPVVSPVVMDFMTSGQKAGAANNNGRILEMHKQGMSKTEIAKELGLGVGEVKLVIDLYNNLFIREDAAGSGE